jgi:hypothetical protein
VVKVRSWHKYTFRGDMPGVAKVLAGSLGSGRTKTVPGRWVVFDKLTDPDAKRPVADFATSEEASDYVGRMRVEKDYPREN